MSAARKGDRLELEEELSSEAPDHLLGKDSGSCFVAVHTDGSLRIFLLAKSHLYSV
jgi:hypothetical protein